MWKWWNWALQVLNNKTLLLAKISSMKYFKSCTNAFASHEAKCDWSLRLQRWENQLTNILITPQTLTNLKHCMTFLCHISVTDDTLSTCCYGMKERKQNKTQIARVLYTQFTCNTWRENNKALWWPPKILPQKRQLKTSVEVFKSKRSFAQEILHSEHLFVYEVLTYPLTKDTSR